jgi:hypothetical protein
MFAVTLRFVAGLAIGAAAALWLARQRRTDQHDAAPAASRDESQADDTALDEAVEGSFPASDPPALTQSVIARPPSRERLTEEDAAEAHPS